MDFAYDSTLAPRAERCSPLFHIAVSKHYILALLSFFTSAVLSGPVEYTPVFEGSTTLAESGIFLPLPAGMQAVVADIELFSVLEASQLDPKEAYLAHQRSREVDREDRASVGGFPFDSAINDVLDIPVTKITISKRTFFRTARRRSGVVERASGE